MRFKNESKRLKKEFSELYQQNMELFDLLVELDAYCLANFSKELTLTMIYRTQEEQDHLYRNSEKYQEKPFKSPHQFWQAADIRSWTFTKQEQKKIERMLNRKYNKANYYRWTAKVHNVGAGVHFHIQFIPKES